MNFKKIIINYIFLNISSILLFSGIYYYLSKTQCNSFHIPSDIINKIASKKKPVLKELEYIDCLYLSVVTQSTVGYGDIVPISKMAKLCCMLQCISILLITFICFSKLIKNF